MIEIDIVPKKPYVNIFIPDPTKKEFEIEIGQPHSGTEYPVYHGPTAIKPEAYHMQILQTNNTVVKENILVLPIPYYETSNPYGGNTVYIGE